MIQFEFEKTFSLENHDEPRYRYESSFEEDLKTTRTGVSNQIGRTFSHKELVTNASILIDGGDYNWAIVLLEQILTQNPHHQLALEKMAQCAVELGEFPLAIDCYQKLTLVHRSDRYKVALADALYRDRQNDLALDLYLDMKDALSEEDLYLVLRNLGNIYARKGALDEARKYYEKVLRLCPVSDELRVNYGILEIQAGHFDEALKWFRNAVESNGHNDGAWVGLAIIHNEYGDPDLSWANLEKALDINPINKTALNLYFEWGIKNHKIDLVRSRYQTVINRYPHRDDLRISLAKVQFCLGLFKEAKFHINVFFSS